jgi:hypothetical protein
VLIVLSEATEINRMRVTTREASPFLLTNLICRLSLEDVKELRMLVCQKRLRQCFNCHYSCEQHSYTTGGGKRNISGEMWSFIHAASFSGLSIRP